MNTKHLIVFGLWMLTARGVWGQGTSFTYQGRLNWNGQPANGTFDFTFSVMTAETGGAVINGSIVTNGLAVTNGLFSVILDPGAGVFSGPPRWISIGVRTNGDPAYTLLTPRQLITTAPYAIRAAEALTAVDATGKIKATEFQLGTVAVAGSILTANASGVGTWQTPAFVNKSGDTMTGDLTIANPADLNFGSSTRQLINLWNTNYGIGVQNFTLYQRSDGGFAWFRLGSHNNNANNPGAGGTNLMQLSSVGDLALNGSVTVDLVSTNTGGVYPGLVFGPGSGESITSARTVGSPNRYGLDFWTGFQKRLSIAGNGSVGIGTSTPEDALLDVEGPIRVNQNDIYFRTGTDRNHGMGHRAYVGSRPVDGPFLYGYNGGALGTSSPETPALSWDYTGNIWVSNNLSLATLTVRGGADLAEPFPMAKDIPEGALMVIDEENAGSLRMSDTAYDKRVAGIVSGANGVNPGITLHQEGLLEGGRHVALSGRVYAMADASHGAIKPGDLLTSSDTAGHVMKVGDPARAQGAVVGKAMTPLKEGKGFVLVLVTLQ
jgi:hypothetical protein